MIEDCITPMKLYNIYQLGIRKRTLFLSYKMASAVKPTEGIEFQKVTLFYTAHSPFSNFYPAVFQSDGVQYSCSEQYMMHQKAVLFKDTKTGEEILRAMKPGKIKQLGRCVQNFNQDVWNENKRAIVKKGVKAKFAQNSDLKEELLKTRGTTLAEASANDRIWGIGLGLRNPLALNKKNWKGQNLLGYILTEIREELIAEG